MKGSNNPNFSHGIGKCRIYRIYTNMKQRCNNPNNHKYKRYGGRGIAICPEWNNPHGLKAFYDWAMANGYSDNLTLDRIDVNGNYEPSNCRWTTNKIQSNNRTNNDIITYNGETHTLSEWGNILGINRGTLWSRLYCLNYPIEKAFTLKPVVGANGFTLKTQQVTLIKFNGETHSYSEWGNIYGIKGSIIRDRVKKGWCIERAITTPQMRKRKQKAVTYETH